ncbi:DUF4097 domain-containing protein [Bacillus sp. CGMCC 1.16607]|uniref:DUF4097 family beta strand repeat-containing protein n=1 Tax=Bacillus sp. CGMCC 1.16607 TaxID=3351842 RepID=UPI00362D5A83
MKQERERILKMVEGGKLTVEEALTLLELLEKDGTTEKLESELSTTAKMEESQFKHESEKKDESYYKFQSAKEKIFEFVDTAFKKLKDIDIDFNFGKSIEMAHIFQQASADFTDMDIHVANGSVKLIPWDQPDVRVECQAKIYRVETLEEARTTFLNGVIFSIENNRLTLQTQHKWMKVDAKVYIPHADYHKVRVRLYNGPIAAENLNVNDMKLDTANGRITLEGVKGHKVDVETANGKIEVKNSYLEEFEAETINGAIKFEGDIQRGELHSFNGNILCAVKGPACEKISLKATTGNIELFVPAEVAVSGELKTNLGNFDVNLKGIQISHEKSEMVQKQLKFQTVQQMEKVLQVISETKTGSIKIKPAEKDEVYF